MFEPFIIKKEIALKKKTKNKSEQITIKIRKDTLEKIDAALAAHIGKTGRIISRAEFIDKLISPRHS